MQKKTISILIIAMVMSGCTGTEPAPKKEIKHFNNKQFGATPNISRFQKQIESKIKSKLKDPYSAKIGKCAPYPKKSSIYNVAAGWSTLCPVNAKNSYGGYTGNKHYNAFIIYNSKTKKHELFSVDPINEAFKKKKLIIFGINDK